MTQPESAEGYYARIAAATDGEGRLPVAVEEMPGWDIFRFEVDSLQIKPLRPLVEEEPPRRGEDAAGCWCAHAVDADDEGLVWWNERWKLGLGFEGTGLPVMVWLSPLERRPSAAGEVRRRRGAPAPAPDGSAGSDAAAAWLPTAGLGGEAPSSPGAGAACQRSADRGRTGGGPGWAGRPCGTVGDPPVRAVAPSDILTVRD